MRSTRRVESLGEFPIASFDQSIDLNIAVVGRLVDIRGQTIDVSKDAGAEAFECRGPELAKDLPIRFRKVSWHDLLQLMVGSLTPRSGHGTRIRCRG